MDRRKELKEKYKNLKPDMGVFVVRYKSDGRCYIDQSKDINSKINRIKFQLKMGSFNNRELQKDWKTSGEDNFIFEVVELLEYSKNESITDYSEDLETLKSMCEENMKKKGIIFY